MEFAFNRRLRADDSSEADLLEEFFYALHAREFTHFQEEIGTGIHGLIRRGGA
jgi:hypothetical protein